MRDLVFFKAKAARESLRLTQTGASKESGWDQASISLLESAAKEFIHNDYLTFLAVNKINLTAMFDPSVSLEEFVTICEGGKPVVQGMKEPCKECEVKERENTMLRENIADLRHVIYGAKK